MYGLLYDLNLSSWGWFWLVTGTSPVDNFTQPSPQTLRFSLGQLVAMRTPLESLHRFVSDRMHVLRQFNPFNDPIIPCFIIISPFYINIGTFLSRYDVWPHASATISAATKTALEAELTSLQVSVG